MTQLRPGSAEAIAFLQKSQSAQFSNVNEWRHVKDKFPQVLQAVAAKKKKGLLELDAFVRDRTLCEEVLERGHITLEELSTIMKYKLLRGKMRPLQSKCDSNNPKNVETASREAFAFANKGRSHTKQAVHSLCKLQAIGPATASLILSLFFPHVAFMADETLDCTSGRDYTMNHCMSLQEHAHSIATSLNTAESASSCSITVPHHHGEWTEAQVSEVLYTYATACAYGISVLESTAAESKHDTTAKIVSIASDAKKEGESVVVGATRSGRKRIHTPSSATESMEKVAAAAEVDTAKRRRR
jgi:hypothetical protein